jgi:hypothetical protein
LSWEELYPVVADQAYWAVKRYDPRQKDKVQELVCQSYEKYIRDTAADPKKLRSRNINASSPNVQKKLIKDLSARRLRRDFNY